MNWRHLLHWHDEDSDTTITQVDVKPGELTPLPPNFTPTHVTLETQEVPDDAPEPVETLAPAAEGFSPPPPAEAPLTPLGGAEQSPLPAP